MTAGRLLGFDRPLSARFSLLLAVPTIIGAGLLGGYDLYQAGNARLTADAVIVPVSLSSPPGSQLR